MAWTGKILRVDLTAGTCKAEPLNMQWAREYIGQRGLATKYFVDEVDAMVDPLSPQNKIIWATGPLTGMMGSTGGRLPVCRRGQRSAPGGRSGVGTVMGRQEPEGDCGARHQGRGQYPRSESLHGGHRHGQESAGR